MSRFILTRGNYEEYLDQLKMDPDEEIKAMALVHLHFGHSNSDDLIIFPDEYLAYISRDKIKNWCSLKVVNRDWLMTRRKPTNGLFNKEFRLYTGLQPHWNNSRGGEPHFCFYGNKYWVGFRFVHPDTDRQEFEFRLMESSGKKETMRSTDPSDIDQYARELRKVVASRRQGFETIFHRR